MSVSENLQDKPKKNQPAIRLLALVELIALLVQFLAGMSVNLFVALPASHPGTQAHDYFSGVVQAIVWAITQSDVLLWFHVVLGLVLVAGSIALLVGAAVSRRRYWIVATLIGWIGATAAGFNGASYLNYGHEFSSLLMAIGWLMAVCAYGYVYYISARTSP